MEGNNNNNGEINVELAHDDDDIPNECNDVFWTIFFYITIIMNVVFACFFKPINNNNSISSNKALNPDAAAISVGIVCAVGYTIFWLWFISRYASIIIKGCVIAGIIMPLIAAIIGIALGLVGVIVFGIVFALLGLLYAYIIWKRIPFAVACLTISVTAFKAFPSPFIVNIFMVIISITFFIIDILAYVGLREIIGENNGFVDIVWFLFQIWHQMTFINVSHTTSCGVMSKWCYGNSKDGVTKESFKRSITTQFGSIAFGSFIIALIRTLEAIVRHAKEQARRSGNAGAACILCFIECIINWLGDMLNYINSYAYVQVAMYNKTFCNAAKDTWELFKTKGFSMLINDDVTNIPIILGFFIGIIIFILVPYAINNDSVISIVIVFVAGLFIYIGVTQIVSSYIKTLFVCWIEDPNKLNQWRPDSYAKLTNAINGYKVVNGNQQNNNNYDRAQTGEASDAAVYGAKD